MQHQPGIKQLPLLYSHPFGRAGLGGLRAAYGIAHQWLLGRIRFIDGSDFSPENEALKE
ncbi:hypothetical protein [Mangrovibacter yixingensis]|uniref:hypothetical protein n=1 Tax=Mangrovibacter yixingensis TaxID=1529639 RepID=UPI001CFE37EB|nr:hypothetical protein [Mangrovibacter yixingensis]